MSGSLLLRSYFSIPTLILIYYTVSSLEVEEEILNWGLVCVGCVWLQVVGWDHSDPHTFHTL